MIVRFINHLSEKESYFYILFFLCFADIKKFFKNVYVSVKLTPATDFSLDDSFCYKNYMPPYLTRYQINTIHCQEIHFGYFLVISQMNFESTFQHEQLEISELYIYGKKYDY